MRKINKQSPILEFTNFVKRKKPTNWKELPSNISAASRFFILCEEQDCLCGYSEIKLEDDPTSSHIDHYYKRDLFPTKTFDWNNLIVSTIDEDFGGKYKDNTYKIKYNEYCQIFNPVVDDMSKFIAFLGNGKMIPLEGMDNSIVNKVKKTIEVFNLNCKSLKDRRRDLIAQLYNCEGLSKEEIRNAFTNKGFISVLNWFLDHGQDNNNVSD